MVEMDDNMRMGMLIGAAVLLVFELLNMPGMLGGGDKLFLLPAIGLTDDYKAWMPATGFSSQDTLAFLLMAAMGALYWFSKEDDLDWEALLGDDDDDEEE